MLRVACGLVLLVVAPLAAACSADSPGDGDGQADAATGDPPADAADVPRFDAGPDGCLDYVPDDWGSNGPIDESQFSIEGNYTYYADMVPDTEPFFQRLFISLHPDRGVFTGGAVEPGTYVVEGDEADNSWCGACVYLAVEDGDTPSTLYQAQAGKLTVDTVSGGEIHGTLASAELVQIDLIPSGPSCADLQEGDPWPCGNSACVCIDDECTDRRCEEQRLVPACTTLFDSFEF